MKITGTKGIMSIFLLFLIILLSSFSVLASTGNNVQLEELLQSIIEEKTTIPDAYTYINIGNFFMNQELYQPAQEEYKKVLEIDSSNTMALVNRSYALFKVEEYDQVLNILDQLTANDKANAYAYYIKGLVYKEQRELEKAIEQYEKVVELIPNHQQLNAELGQLYLDDHQLIKANERFVKMGYSQPRPQIMDKLLAYQVDAYCYLHLGNYYHNNN